MLVLSHRHSVIDIIATVKDHQRDATFLPRGKSPRDGNRPRVFMAEIQRAVIESLL